MEDQSIVPVTQQSYHSTQTGNKTMPIIIFTVLALSLGLCAWLGYMVYFQTQNNNSDSLAPSKLNQVLVPSISPTNEPVATPKNMPIPTSTTLINMESSYNQALDELRKSLDLWDSKFAVTGFSATFADTADQAKRLQGGENTGYPASFMIKVYSTSKDTFRDYEYDLKSGVLSAYGSETDLSKSRPNGVPYSTDQRFPLVGIQSAIDKCLSHAKTQSGTYYLHSCSYGNDQPQLTSSPGTWLCDFIEDTDAKEKEYLYQASNYLCGFDGLPNKSVTWIGGGPLPISR